MEQVHARRTGRQLLLPERDLVRLHRRGEYHHQRGSLGGELRRGLLVARGRFRVFGAQDFDQLERQRRSCIVGHDHEAPGGELAMIGRARGDCHHLIQLLRARPRRGEISRLARAAGLKECERRRAIVEGHGRHLGRCPAAAKPHDFTAAMQALVCAAMHRTPASGIQIPRTPAWSKHPLPIPRQNRISPT